MIPELIGQETRAGHVQRVLRGARDMDLEYLRHGSRQDKVYTPWWPFPVGEFVSFMIEIVAEAHGREFLDIGCGPGTKLDLAAALFGLEACGVEVDAVMAGRASANHLVWNQDALEFPWYRDFDIIWLYRPFRDSEKEAKLEQVILREMKPGAIIAGGEWEMEQPPAGWPIVIDDWETGRRGAWMKPGVLDVN